MNYAIVLRLLSYILYCEAALLLLPAMASLIYGEWMVLGVFLLTAALSAVAGRSAPPHQAQEPDLLYAGGLCHHGALLAAYQVVGAVPFVLTGRHSQPGGCHV